MGAASGTTIIVTSSLDEAYQHALIALVTCPADSRRDGPVVMFGGEGATPDAALADAVEAIREQAAAHDAQPAQVTLDGSLRTDAGYRLWGTLELTDGQATGASTVGVRIAQGEEGTWTVTTTRSQA